jgi:hypothetical protein
LTVGCKSNDRCESFLKLLEAKRPSAIEAHASAIGLRSNGWDLFLQQGWGRNGSGGVAWMALVSFRGWTILPPFLYVQLQLLLRAIMVKGPVKRPNWPLGRDLGDALLHLGLRLGFVGAGASFKLRSKLSQWQLNERRLEMKNMALLPPQKHQQASPHHDGCGGVCNML